MRVTTWTGCYDNQWRGLIVPEAFSHPAKFSPGLIQRIYRHGMEQGSFAPGSIVGDPFGGIGGGGIFAAYAGLKWIGCELEQKFVDLANQNFALHHATWKAHGYPEPIIIQGDSRRFAEIVGECSSILTSPPFVDCLDMKSGGNLLAKVAQKHGNNKARWEHGEQKDYGTTPGQIGAMKAGGLRAIVTSPPFETCDQRGADHEYSWNRKSGESFRRGASMTGYPNSKGQIGNLRSGGLDAITTSPPYADSVNSQAHGIDWTKAGPATGNRKRGDGCKQGETFDAHLNYSTNPQNIGNLRSGGLDAITTSPPFEKQQAGGGIGKALRGEGDYPWEFIGKSRKGGSLPGYMCQGNSEGQIADSTGENYWTAMRQVYAECHKALKPGGVLICVLKAYVKNKRKVPLPQQTLKLLIHLGFEPVERIKAMLTQSTVQGGLFGADIVKEKARKSFFRRLAEKNGSPRIDWEEVLICRKHSTPAQAK